MDDIYGRLIALELLMQGFMTKVAAESGHPGQAFVEGWRADMKASLQHLERPIGEHSDAVWAEATKALDLLFDNVSRRAARL